MKETVALRELASFNSPGLWANEQTYHYLLPTLGRESTRLVHLYCCLTCGATPSIDKAVVVRFSHRRGDRRELAERRDCHASSFTLSIASAEFLLRTGQRERNEEDTTAEGNEGELRRRAPFQRRIMSKEGISSRGS